MPLIDQNLPSQANASPDSNSAHVSEDRRQFDNAIEALRIEALKAHVKALEILNRNEPGATPGAAFKKMVEAVEGRVDNMRLYAVQGQRDGFNAHPEWLAEDYQGKPNHAWINHMQDEMMRLRKDNGLPAIQNLHIDEHGTYNSAAPSEAAVQDSILGIVKKDPVNEAELMDQRVKIAAHLEELFGPGAIADKDRKSINANKLVDHVLNGMDTENISEIRKVKIMLRLLVAKGAYSPEPDAIHSTIFSHEVLAEFRIGLNMRAEEENQRSPHRSTPSHNDVLMAKIQEKAAAREMIMSAIQAPVDSEQTLAQHRTVILKEVKKLFPLAVAEKDRKTNNVNDLVNRVFGSTTLLGCDDIFRKVDPQYSYQVRKARTLMVALAAENGYSPKNAVHRKIISNYDILNEFGKALSESNGKNGPSKMNKALYMQIAAARAEHHAAAEKENMHRRQVQSDQHDAMNTGSALRRANYSFYKDGNIDQYKNEVGTLEPMSQIARNYSASLSSSTTKEIHVMVDNASKNRGTISENDLKKLEVIIEASARLGAYIPSKHVFNNTKVDDIHPKILTSERLMAALMKGINAHNAKKPFHANDAERGEHDWNKEMLDKIQEKMPGLAASVAKKQNDEAAAAAKREEVNAAVPLNTAIHTLISAQNGGIEIFKNTVKSLNPYSEGNTEVTNYLNKMIDHATEYGRHQIHSISNTSLKKLETIIEATAKLGAYGDMEQVDHRILHSKELNKALVKGLCENQTINEGKKSNVINNLVAHQEIAKPNVHAIPPRPNGVRYI